MKKRLGIIVLLGLMISTTLFAQGNIKIIINDKAVTTSIAPVKDSSGTMLIPLSVISEQIGAKLSYDSKKQLVAITKGEIQIKFTLSSKKIYVNGKEQAVAISGKSIKDSIMISSKVIQQLGYFVAFDIKSNTLLISNDSSVTGSINKVETVEKPDAKNIYTPEFLQKLVDTTDCNEDVLKFRQSSNPRRNGLLKQEGKYCDMYYPDDEYAKEVVKFLTPHIDKAYMMLTDLYGIQAKAEVHLIDGVVGKQMMSEEGEIRDKENVTFIWLEEWNDRGGNNISELVHELNHNFFDQANGKRSYTLWLNEANAKTIPSLYIKHNYKGIVDMWSFYTSYKEAKFMFKSLENKNYHMDIKELDKYLSKGDAWEKKSGGEDSPERIAQRYGMYLWSYMYNQSPDLDTFKSYLRNMSIGNNDTLVTLEKVLNKPIKEIEKDFYTYLK